MFVLASVCGPGFGPLWSERSSAARRGQPSMPQYPSANRAHGWKAGARLASALFWKPGRNACASVHARRYKKFNRQHNNNRVYVTATLPCKYFIYLTHLLPTRALCGGDCHSFRFATNRSKALSCSKSAQILPTAAGAHPKLSMSLPLGPQHALYFPHIPALLIIL